MKKLITLILILVCGHTMATDYYFSQFSGSDAAAGTQSFPFQSLAKFNSLSHTAGNRFYFQCGNTWYGTLNINGSGTSGNNVIISSYGTGAKPIITGFTDVFAFTNLGSNIWESTSAVSASVTATKMVSINGTNAVMGRYPNTGYESYTYSSGDRITCAALTNVRDWTGSQIVIRMNRYVIDVNTITSQAGSTINYTTTDNTYAPASNFGCFVQNNANTLDVQNEWYYNPSTRKIRIYSTSTPTNVKVATLDYLVNLTGRSYVNISSIDFEGSNVASVYGAVTPPSYPTINSCDFDFSGQDAIYFHPNSSHPTVTNNTFNNSNNCAVYLASSDYVTINNNIIRNSGTMAGRGEESVGTYSGIHSYGDWGTINSNTITNSGYNGMKADGEGTVVYYNYVDTFCNVLDDGGGIYFFPSQGQTSYTNQRKIKFNTVINGIGAGVGTPGGANSNEADGIYMDGATTYVDIDSNNVAYIGDFGIFFNNSNNCNARGNVVYDCGNSALLWTRYTTLFPVNNNTIYNNQFVAKDASQKCMYLRNDVGGTPNFYTGNNNNFSRPIDDNVTIEAYGNNYTLAQWKAFSGQDAASTKSPKSVSSTSELRYVYNQTAGSVTTNLGATYINVLNVSFPGTITTGAYKSNALILNSTSNTPPTCSAGADATITLPFNSVSLVATAASTTGGSITTYLWEKTSGTGGTISGANASVAFAQNLTQGSYTYRLTVTDNNGLQCQDSKNVTVNAALVIPTANAGSDQSITLPTNSVTLSGSGSGGTITSYFWSLLSGSCVGCNFGSNTSATTSFTGLTAGIYSVRLRVGNDDGNFGYDTVQITVYAAPVAPTCNAGTTPVSITLPTNSVGLTATGSGANAVSFLWSKVSGTGGSITSPTSASTTATGLTQGSYVYRITVTDNVSGLTCTSDKSITVNAATPLIPPTVNAGANQTIQLPTNSVTVAATAVASSGSITGYQWIKVTGGAATITSATNASTTITGLVAGVYTFSVTATQTNGLTATDTVQITVNAANSQPATGIKYLQASLWTNPSQTVLGWTSDITDNTKYFVLQKKTKNGTYGNRGANIIPKIGTVDYWAYDFKPAVGANTYRIKVVDKSGTTYSEEKTVVKKKGSTIGGNIIL